MFICAVDAVKRLAGASEWTKRDCRDLRVREEDKANEIEHAGYWRHIEGWYSL